MSKSWSRAELLVAFELYTRLSFGQFHSKNPVIIQTATALARTPSALAMKLCNIASIDPTFRATGRLGLAGASSADRLLWEEMNDDWGRFALEAQQSLRDFSLAAQDSEELPFDATGAAPTERTVESVARIGQVFFRRALLGVYGGRCCVSGLAIPALLVASHIVPWRHSPTQRLNPRNGLLLSALHDRAFDGGLMTLDDDFCVVISPVVKEGADPYFQAALGSFHGSVIEMPEKFGPSPDFLAYHRENLFLA
ncbi:MAG: HNH endonuclease [Nitrospinae bacterium]|nr:HNH endonuclease [Nitrospinota bacterium]